MVCVVLCGSVEGGCVVLVCVHIYSMYSYMQFHYQKSYKYCVMNVIYIVFVFIFEFSEWGVCGVCWVVLQC